MGRKKKLSPEEWEKFWSEYMFAGATSLVLGNIAKKIGVTLDDLKERIQTPTSRQLDRDLLKHT